MSAGKVVTVGGPREPVDIGITLPHEHLFLHLDNWFIPPRTPEEERYAHALVADLTPSHVRYRPFSNWDNIRIQDFDEVLAEVRAFAEAGGGTIVDLTPAAIGRDPLKARAIAERTGVNVVCGCGYYVESSHPPELNTMSAEDVATEIARELVEGIEDSGVRAGVIGEIGTSWPVTPAERKVLAGAALAHRRTGAPISLHLSSTAHYGHEVLDVLEENGVALDRVVVGHLDGPHPIDVEAHASIAARGAYVEYDLFGVTEFSEDGLWAPPACDLERIDALRALWEVGHGARLLLSHDVCTKIQQRAHGGFGFSHLPGHVAPLMMRSGFDQGQVNTMLRANPSQWLTWSEPTD
jgi:phosphotriesterase-related protein